MRGIPQRYIAEYRARKTSLIKSRVGLLCVLVLALYLLATILTYAISPSSFDPHEIPLAVFFVAGAMAVFYLNARAKRTISIKINAYLFMLLALIFLTRVSMLYKEYFSSSASLYLFVLFTISFAMPWDGIEISGIAAMHGLAFSRLFAYSLRHLPTEAHVKLSQEYTDGMLLILMGFFLCLVIRRKDNALDIENYLLFKEIETKNTQMRSELELATRIHKTLVPHSINTDRADIAVAYLPMYYMGGDYAKFQFIDKDGLFFIIADVTGHGVSAALMVNRLHTEVERLIFGGRGPGSLLNELNDLIIKKFDGINIFLSAFAGFLDFRKKALVYSNHGHPAQYIYHIRNSSIARLPSQAGLLGISQTGGGIDERSVDFEDGDRILLFTDGVIETKNDAGSLYGEGRLEDFIKKNYILKVEEFNERLLTDLNSFKKGDFEDDIFILNIYTKPQKT